MGTSWRFQAFYNAFRGHMARQLGMSDYSQVPTPRLTLSTRSHASSRLISLISLMLASSSRVAQLSMFSPLPQRRVIPPSKQNPIDLWALSDARGGARSSKRDGQGACSGGAAWPPGAASRPAMPALGTMTTGSIPAWPAASSAGAMSTSVDNERRRQFKRTKAKFAPTSLPTAE